MKRFRFLLFCGLVLLLLGSTASASMTYGSSAYQTTRGGDLSRTPMDFFYQFVAEVDGYMSGTSAIGSIYLDPTDTEPGTSEGMFYYDDSENVIKVRGPSSWGAIGSGTFTGGSITSDITMSDGEYMRPSTTTAHVTGIQVYDTTGTWENALTVTNGATGAVVLGDVAATLAISSLGGLNVDTAGATSGITSLAMGGALTGVTTFSMSGAMSAGSYTFPNGGTFANDTDTELTFGENSEDLAWDFTNNGITWESSTGVVAMDFGDVDAFTGINTIALDAAAGGLSLAADGAGDDLTVAVTGAQNASLVLASSGTAEDAMTLTTTAGGINITNGGAASGEDLDLVSSNASVVISGGEAVTDSIDIDSAGGVDVDTVDDIALTVVSGTAGEDILLTQTGANESSITLTAAGTGTDAIGLLATAGTVDIDGDKVTINTTEDMALTVTSSTAGEDILITQTGANESSITLAAAGTGTDAIGLQASAGGVDIDAPAAFDLGLAGGQVAIVSKDDAASAISLTANVGTSETIVVTNTQGTGASAITLAATDGGVNIDAAEANDVDISGGQVLISSKTNEASAIALTANQGAAETILVTNTQGTDEAAINIDATAGGIDIDFATGKNMAVTGGQFIVTSNEAVASAINLVTNTGAAETIVATNTQGTAEGAITLTSTAGGVDLNAAALKNITLDGGQILMESADNVASSIALTTNNGALETIVVTNTQGTSESAITLASTAGGVNIDAAAAKDVAIDGGQVLINSKTEGASAIAATTNQGATDTIVVTNTQGTDAASIDLVATAGGITMSPVSTSRVLVEGDLSFQRETEVLDANDTFTLLGDPSGKMFIIEDSGAGPNDVTLTLPSVAAAQDGWVYTIVDANETATYDVHIEPVDGDKINGTADGFSSDGTDKLPCSVTLMYVHSRTDWIVIHVAELANGTAAWDSDS